ncbi:hypothetical protein GQ54DRAFT_75957 [Martensiomyces pterosporus]|nr:hypothetical protein GQ54DRAFT_75957 [Martensiomyces pterosporus]
MPFCVFILSLECMAYCWDSTARFAAACTSRRLHSRRPRPPAVLWCSEFAQLPPWQDQALRRSPELAPRTCRTSQPPHPLLLSSYLPGNAT